jgi:hypothetical protein
MVQLDPSLEKAMFTVFEASKGLFSSTGFYRVSHSTEPTSAKKLLSRL